MSASKKILLLGDPRLYEKCSPIKKDEIKQIKGWVNQMRDAMEDIRRIYGFGRGIAAPQLGIMKRLIYIHVETPKIIVNPHISNQSEDLFEMWDDCMSLPNLLVRLKRHKHITLSYKDELWNDHKVNLSDDMSELIQHEVDHLDGILCTMRALDSKSFKWKKNI